MLHLEDQWARDLTITTGLVDASSTPLLMRLVATGQLDASRLVTHHFGMDDFEQAYDLFDAATDGALKVVLIRQEAQVMKIIEEHASQLGFTASVSFTGPSGPGPDETLTNDILAVTREALSNCARHAHATAVAISLARQDGLITLDITDNGRGLGTPTRSSGLASMRRRAERNRGTLQITSPSGGGTQLTWTARPAA